MSGDVSHSVFCASYLFCPRYLVSVYERHEFGEGGGVVGTL